MISHIDKEKILELAKKYEVSQVVLFGSAAIRDDFRDIDLGVVGLKPELFFQFYGEAIMQLSKPIDLIDMDKNSSFVDLVRKDGMRIYG